MISNDTLQVCMNILSDVKVSVLDPHAEVTLKVIRKAIEELQEELKGRNGHPA